ncbi:hypothetical protein K470DRAFT_294846 [Piedraia hortae CBS 480.64]|uniref:DUF7924 domain-containing protein n=1 Tax=Piedraia hortae CBS 480.64 TaxID=1314780 RepID=A0A6A7BZN1_9PEZI|nr:hypothetical protein K470DRAFT_294846 [Piedraia hortae CBS 480.64]
MTLAVRGVVDHSRMVNREKELDREILAWSIVHDAISIKLFGHYAVIEGSTQSYYVHRFESLSIDYDKWHRERICSAIDDLTAGVDSNVGQGGLINGISLGEMLAKQVIHPPDFEPDYYSDSD